MHHLDLVARVRAAAFQRPQRRAQILPLALRRVAVAAATAALDVHAAVILLVLATLL